MKAQDIRGLSEKEAEDKIKELNEELFNLKFQLATGKIENPSRLRNLRRDIARIRTVLREKNGKRAGAAGSSAVTRR